MGNEQTFTLAEFREGQRDAWEACAEWIRDGQFPAARLIDDAARKAAEIRYPAPMRPRVVTDFDGIDWSIQGGRMVCRNHTDSAWRDPWAYTVAINAARVKLWTDLLAHPEEPAND